MFMDAGEVAANRIAYLLFTHPVLASEDLLRDAMEDLTFVAPHGWTPPANREEAQRRWEESWSVEPEIPKIV